MSNNTWFDGVVRWNKERGLDTLPFDHLKEASFIVEELFESTGKYTSESARKHAIKVSAALVRNPDGSDEDIVDAFADIIVYATGAILKLGFDPAKTMEEVLKAIDSRKGKLVDGKFVKDPDAVRYEPDYSKCRLKG